LDGQLGDYGHLNPPCVLIEYCPFLDRCTILLWNANCTPIVPDWSKAISGKGLIDVGR
jgi:hypothetical protein